MTSVIANDQPTCFPPQVICKVSSRVDGTMLDRSLSNRHDGTVVANRQKFCDRVGIYYTRCVYQIINFDDETSFDTIQEVAEPNTKGVRADVLYTETPGVGLFLPIADCVGTVIYDQKRHVIALAHLGRHASIAKTITKTIQFFIKKGSDPVDLIIWTAPSVTKDSYRMEYFDYYDDPDWQDFALVRKDGVYLDLVGFNVRLAINAGVLEQNIHCSSINTAENPDYFSHSRGDTTGRFALIAMLAH